VAAEALARRAAGSRSAAFLVCYGVLGMLAGGRRVTPLLNPARKDPGFGRAPFCVWSCGVYGRSEVVSTTPELR
jgi:hypothetical protein